MTNYNLKWSKANKKVKKLKDDEDRSAISFGIPAFESEDGFKTCPGAGSCAAVCYARQGHYQWSNVRSAREFNLEIAKNSPSKFAKLAIEDLKKIPHKIIRVHDSGDFFNQSYLDAWYKIAQEFPEKKFYAYTKSFHLDLYSNKPNNFQIIQSEGSKWDKKIDKRRSHARIFSSAEARESAGYIDGDASDYNAVTGKKKIGFVYHGTKKLTEAQKKHFS